MTRAGNEMMAELSSLLGTSTVKTAAKKDDDGDKKEKGCKCGKDGCKCKCKGDKDDCKCKAKDKKEKKSSVILGVMNDLVKLAGVLDDLGADKASELVDTAIQSVVAEADNMDFSEVGPEMDESFEDAPWRENVPSKPEPNYEDEALRAQEESMPQEDTEELYNSFAEKIGEDKIEEFYAWLGTKVKG